jgi:hypothetical protein
MATAASTSVATNIRRAVRSPEVVLESFGGSATATEGASIDAGSGAGLSSSTTDTFARP